MAAIVECSVMIYICWTLIPTPDECIIVGASVWVKFLCEKGTSWQISLRLCRSYGRKEVARSAKWDGWMRRFQFCKVWWRVIILAGLRAGDARPGWDGLGEGCQPRGGTRSQRPSARGGRS
jgi:hypothetical protein